MKINKSKTLFLTGASGGIGFAVSKKFAEADYKIIAPNHKELDLANPQSIKNYFKDLLPEIDVFIHAAGINITKAIEDSNIDEYAEIQQINITSFYELLKIFIPQFKKKKSGHILGISSLWSVMSRANRASYTISKHALNGLVQTASLELAPYNILVNALSPGFVDTKLTYKNNNLVDINLLKKHIPLGRLACSEEIAEAAYFLCSSQNTYITGQNILIDGGITAGFAN